MSSHHPQLLWGLSVPLLTTLALCQAATTTLAHIMSSRWDKITQFYFRQTHKTSAAGLSFTRNSWEVSSACVFLLFMPSSKGVFHPHLRIFNNPSACWVFVATGRCWSPLSTRQCPPAGSVAVRMLVSPATDAVRFCEEGLPAGSARSIVLALPLQLASSLLWHLNIAGGIVQARCWWERPSGGSQPGLLEWWLCHHLSTHSPLHWQLHCLGAGDFCFKEGRSGSQNSPFPKFDVSLRGF